MRIAVCVKQVPDAGDRLRVAGDGKWIDEDELKFVINESDQYALEEGLKLAEASGGEVVAISLGPARVQEALRKALALGAKRAIQLDDPAFAGGDAQAAARALAAAIQREDFDLVLTGAQSDDQGFGSTGSITAGIWTRKISFMPLSISRMTLALAPPSSTSTPITSQA